MVHPVPVKEKPHGTGKLLDSMNQNLQNFRLKLPYTVFLDLPARLDMICP